MISRSRIVAMLAAAVAAAGCGGGGTTTAPAPTDDTTPTGASTVTARVIDGDTETPVGGIPISAWGPSTPPPYGPVGATDAEGRWPVPDGAVGAFVPSSQNYPKGAAGIAPGFTGEVTVRLYDPRVQSPEYGGGPQRTRYVPAVNLPVPRGKPSWKYGGKSLLEFPPAVSNGVAVLANNSGRVIAFDVKTGRAKWTLKHTNRNNIAASPSIVIGEQIVIVAGMDGRLVAYDLATGKQKWRFSTGGSPIESSPLVVKDTVYVGAWNGRLYAVSTKSGKQRWSYRASRDIKGSAVAAGPLIIVGDYGGTLHGVDAKSGKGVWRKKLGQRFYGGPGVSQGRAVVGDVGGAVIAFSPSTGNELWRHRTGNYVYASPAIANGLVYIGSYTGRFEAINIRTGKVKWSFNAGGRIGGSATVVGKNVYVSTLARRGEKNRTFGLNADTGKVTWRGTDGRYSPAVAAGRTLFIVGRTTLYAYNAP